MSPLSNFRASHRYSSYPRRGYERDDMSHKPRLSAGLLTVLGFIATIGAFATDMYLASFTDITESLGATPTQVQRSEEHTSELQSRGHLVCRLLLEKKT